MNTRVVLIILDPLGGLCLGLTEICGMFKPLNSISKNYADQPNITFNSRCIACFLWGNNACSTILRFECYFVNSTKFDGWLCPQVFGQGDFSRSAFIWAVIYMPPAHEAGWALRVDLGMEYLSPTVGVLEHMHFVLGPCNLKPRSYKTRLNHAWVLA